MDIIDFIRAADKEYTKYVEKFNKDAPAALHMPPWEKLDKKQQLAFTAGFIIGMQTKEKKKEEVHINPAEKSRFQNKDNKSDSVLITISSLSGEPLVLFAVSKERFKDNRELLDTLVASMGADPTGIEAALRDIDTAVPLADLKLH